MLTSPSDTLVLDTAKLNVWLQDSDYDYSRELVSSQKSLMGWLSDQINHFLRNIFDSEFYQTYGDALWITLGLVVLLSLLVFALYRYTSVFGRSRQQQMKYEVSEDTIYGVDFAKEIEAALARKDYRETLRLLYLQTLKSLSDRHRIVWQPFKTPTQYTYEYRNVDFRKMTNLFIRVRYGNFEATELMVSEMRGYQRSVDNLLLSPNEEGGER